MSRGKARAPQPIFWDDWDADLVGTKAVTRGVWVEVMRRTDTHPTHRGWIEGTIDSIASMLGYQAQETLEGLREIHAKRVGTVLRKHGKTWREPRQKLRSGGSSYRVGVRRYLRQEKEKCEEAARKTPAIKHIFRDISGDVPIGGETPVPKPVPVPRISRQESKKSKSYSPPDIPLADPTPREIAIAKIAFRLKLGGRAFRDLMLNCRDGRGDAWALGVCLYAESEARAHRVRDAGAFAASIILGDKLIADENMIDKAKTYLRKVDGARNDDY